MSLRSKRGVTPAPVGDLTRSPLSLRKTDPHRVQPPPPPEPKKVVAARQYAVTQSDYAADGTPLDVPEIRVTATEGVSVTAEQIGMALAGSNYDMSIAGFESTHTLAEEERRRRTATAQQRVSARPYTFIEGAEVHSLYTMMSTPRLMNGDPSIERRTYTTFYDSDGRRHPYSVPDGYLTEFPGAHTAIPLMFEMDRQARRLTAAAAEHIAETFFAHGRVRAFVMAVASVPVVFFVNIHGSFGPVVFEAFAVETRDWRTEYASSDDSTAADTIIASLLGVVTRRLLRGTVLSDLFPRR